MASDDVTGYGCQHITGETVDGFLTFCEAAVKPGSSYCPEHYGRKYIKIADYQAEPYSVNPGAKSAVIEDSARLSCDLGTPPGLQVSEVIGPYLFSGTDSVSVTPQRTEK